jgi:hypothetical protein
MASYAVQVRIDGVRPQRLGSPIRRARATHGIASVAIDHDQAPVDLVGRPLGEIVAERWSRIREASGQMTFFLFDPDSWR